MAAKNEEQRRAERFDTEVKVFYHFAYDIETKVKFQKVDKKKEKESSQKYTAISRNVSVNGLCFNSEKKLNKGDILNLEVYLPTSKIPVFMHGEVRWSGVSKEKSGKKKMYETGVLLETVNGEPVDSSIFFDKVYQVEWSVVLEAVLGTFRIIAQKRKEFNV